MKIQKLYLLFFSLLMIAINISCEDDDETIVVTDVNVTATISTDRELVEETDDLGYNIMIDRTFASDVDMRVNIRFKDGRQFKATLTIPAGETSASGLLLFRSDDGITIDPFQNGGILNDFITVNVIGIVVSEPTVGENYVISSNDVLLDLTDGGPGFLNVQGIVATLTWETEDDNYDLFYNGNLANAGGATTDNPELIFMVNDDILEGDSQLVYNPAEKISMEDVSYRVFVRITQADGSTELLVFSGTLDAANSSALDIYDLININKTTDASGVSSYVITALED